MGRLLAFVALFIAAALLALAWRDGRPDYQCTCSCDRAGTAIPPEEWRARVNADDDRGYLLVFALLTSASSVVGSLIGIAAVPGQRVLYAGAAVVGSGLGIAALLSIPVLVPCLGD